MRAQITCILIGALVALYGLGSIIRKRPLFIKNPSVKEEKLYGYALSVGLGCMILGGFWIAYPFLLFPPSVLLFGSFLIVAAVLTAERHYTREEKD